VLNKFKLNNIYSALLAIIIFLVPSNLFLKFFVDGAYVNGLLVDYLIPKLYLSDIFILLILIIWFLQSTSRQIKTNLNTKTVITASLIFIFVSYQFLTAKPLASLWYFLKLAEMGLFALFLTKHKKLLITNHILAVLLASLLFQSSLAIYQFFAQTSFANYLFLGETNLNNYIGLAKGVFNGVEKILPYGSTAHPNILAGFLVIYLALATKLISKHKKISSIYYLVSAFSLYALYLTQSVSAWIALGIGMLIFCFCHSECNRGIPFEIVKFVKSITTYKKVNNSKRDPSTNGRGDRVVILIIAITVFMLSPILINQLAIKYPQNNSLTRRDNLNMAAKQMFLANPIFGVGLNNFTARVEEYLPETETTRFVQPVHHLGLLVLSEMGLLGISIIILAIYFFSQQKQYLISDIRYPIFILLPLATLDHYLLTNQTGLLLLVFFLNI